MKIMLKCKKMLLLPVSFLFLLILSSTLPAHPKVEPHIINTGMKIEEANIAREKTESIGNHKTRRNFIETKTERKETINNLSIGSTYLLGKNGNTMDMNISNPRVDGNYFKFEIQIRRTNTWESGLLENALGHVDFYFDRNADAFTGTPSYENLHTDLTGNNYTCTAQVNGDKLQFKIVYSLQDTNFFKPYLDVYETVCTMVWEIADFSQNSGVTWDQLNTGALTAANNAINLTYYGSGDISFSIGIDDENNYNLPKGFTLHPNYPNPFNLVTTISFSTTESTGNTEIYIYNLKGQKIKTLVNEVIPAGNHTTIWNGKDEFGKDVSPGVYFYKLQTDRYSKVKKMTLLKQHETET